MSSATFSQIRNSALSLENQTDKLLAQYSKIQQVGNSVASDDAELNLVNDITQILEKREDIIARLKRSIETDSAAPASRSQQVQRHKEVLADHRSSFLKIQSKISEERNRNNLLFLIRLDLSAHKQRNVSSASGINENDYILEEGRRVEQANSFADRLLQQAYETRDELIGQQAFLQNAQSRIAGTIQQIPGINVLVSRINTRRKRDTLILASVISLCIIGLLFFS
ncbi:hypothetical protein PUMCH_000089 [Australozyma saopauloensis]|uniref:Golgi SNAP receptor complex member 1 n=1 Tax=Australozyma saopauloensis TaxID=291208 RepID=A0AAX4H3V0_9ASCO|nr:hypothetical protein PUMCH_000089 [[Candida] saopauloensis]